MPAASRPFLIQYSTHIIQGTTKRMLKCIIIEPRQTAARSVIWLHGLGASGNDFAPIVPELNLPPDHAIRFIFPHAPLLPVTLNGGMVMPAWYDLSSITDKEQFNHYQLTTSINALHQLINNEINRGITSEQIVIIGFSQGGVVAYHGALTYPQRLAGILGLSTCLPGATQLQPHPSNAALPITIFHGTQDTVIPETLAYTASQILGAMGLPTQYYTYPMEHTVCPQELEDISQVLKNLLSLNK